MNDPYAATILDDKPVGYWRLNERSHDDQVIDQSGHNHHGRLFGRPSLGEQGAIHGSPDCSMSFVAQARIEIPHSPDFSIQTSGKGLTVEVWMRPNALHFQGEGDKKYIHWLGKGESK